MGAYTCEFGVVHKMCRCPTEHTIKCDVPAEHGPDKDIKVFIEDMESRFFRTATDTGANPNAMFVWNLVREWAGLDRLTVDDLHRRHAEIDGKRFEDVKQAYEEYREWQRSQR